MGSGGFGSLLFLVIICGIIYLVYRQGGFGGRRGQNASETPRDILDRRYASGELSKAQYDQMRQELLNCRKRAFAVATGCGGRVVAARNNLKFVVGFR